jgi:hypothetical protein
MSHLCLHCQSYFVFFIFFIINKILIFCIYGGMGHIDEMINSKMMGEDLCLADSCTTHTILRDKNISNI